jgi:hypothetical protein
VVARGAEDRGERRRRIGEPGKHRRDGDAAGDAGIGERPDRAQALPRRRDAELEPRRQALVERRDAHVHPDRGAPRRIGQDVDVTDDERTARDEIDRGPRIAQGDQASARQPIPTLGRLIRIRGGPDRSQGCLPSGVSSSGRRALGGSGGDPCAEERHVELVTGRALIVLAVIVISLLAVFWLLAVTRHSER